LRYDPDSGAGLAEQDRHRGNLDKKREKFVLESIAEMIEGIGQRVQSAESETVLTTGKESAQVGSSHFSVFCLPAADQADEIPQVRSRSAAARASIPVAV